MRLAALQYRPHKGNPATSRAALRSLIYAAGEEKADLIVCPEMATTGYIWPDAETLRPHAETPDGETFQMLSQIAAELGAWIVCGFPERTETALYNSALVVDSGGSLAAVYRKNLLFEADWTWAQPGTNRTLIDTFEGGLAPAICMDLNDEALLDWLNAHRPKVLAFCTNWLEEQLPVHLYWRWRLQHFAGYFVAANSWGMDGTVEFCGQSAIFGPNGVPLVSAPRTGDGILIVDTDEYETATEIAGSAGPVTGDT